MAGLANIRIIPFIFRTGIQTLGGVVEIETRITLIAEIIAISVTESTFRMTLLA